MTRRVAGLLPIEPETARTGIVLKGSSPVGAGCLISSRELLTCRHVVEQAIGRKLGSTSQRPSEKVEIALIGVDGQPTLRADIRGWIDAGPEDYALDLALLTLAEEDAAGLAVRSVEFSTPISHSGKTFAVMGFPENRPHGVHASGTLRASERNGLVQMDGEALLTVEPGFSGAPVWCPMLRSFVGLVVATEKTGLPVAWCIPSRILARFHPSLQVRFRVPPADRPVINDRETDDPNRDLFGDVADNGSRRLTARIEKGGKRNAGLTVWVRYECLPGSMPPRGQLVTFITYPDFERDDEDAYELCERLENGVAETSFYPSSAFTVAAIGDAGDTALTIDLVGVKGAPRWFYD